MSKGGAWEREISEELSLWWSGGGRYDIFWRTSGSGARATTNNRKGKLSKLHCGDICAIDPLGQPLMDLLVLELKRGYNIHTPFELLDKSKGAKQQQWEKWIIQAQESQEHAGSFSWLIIQKRDRREPFVMFPSALCETLEEVGMGKLQPLLILELESKGGTSYHLSLTTLLSFLRVVQPGHVLKALRKMQKEMRAC